MDHLPILPDNRPPPFPYLGIGPIYDLEGFIDFPSRCGISLAKLLTLSQDSFHTTVSGEDAFLNSFEKVESFVQEWLYFGILHEFGLYCRRPLDIYEFITVDERNGNWILTTKSLPGYVRAVAIQRLNEYEVPLDLKAGDVVVPHPQFAEAEQQVMESKSKRFVVAEVHEDQRCSIYLASDAEKKLLPGTFSVAYLHHADDLSARGAAKDYQDDHTIPPQVVYDTLHRAHDCFTLPSRELGLRRLTRCLRLAQTVLDRLVNRSKSPIRPYVAVSIFLLIRAIPRAVYRLFMARSSEPQENTFLRYYLERHKRRNNWCLSRLQWLSTASLELVFAASWLNSYDKRNHCLCTNFGCFYSRTFNKKLACKDPTGVPRVLPRALFLPQVNIQSDDQVYLVKRSWAPKLNHDLFFCAGNCRLKTFDLQKLLSLLELGQIPGIRQTPLKNGESDYEVVDTTGQRYVAISHVWSHGMGNPYHNALWLCQLQGLFEKLRALGEEDALLWIDTLLVPTAAEFKPLALAKMRQVYCEAAKVLVVDAHLMQVGNDPIEQTLQLLQSEWMTRLWTFQEGALAMDLWVQFKHKAVPVKDFLEEKPHNDDRMAIFGEDHRILSKALRRRFMSGEEPRGLLDVAEDLSTRNTTVAEDEPLVLDAILELNIVSKDRLPTMEDIYMALPKIPAGIIFFPGPRLSNKGFRWAPRTLLGHGRTRRYISSQPVLCDNDGIHVETACIMLKSVFDLMLFLSDPADSFSIIVSNSTKTETFLVKAERYAKMPPVPPSEIAKAAILIQIPAKVLESRSTALLVRNVVDVNGRFHCSYVTLLSLQRLQPGHTPGLSYFLDRPIGRRHRPLRRLYGYFHEKQAFCID